MSKNSGSTSGGGLGLSSVLLVVFMQGYHLVMGVGIIPFMDSFYNMGNHTFNNNYL